MRDGKRSIAGVARLGAGAAGFGVSLGYCAWRLARSRRDDLAHDVALVMSRLTLGWGRVIVDVHGEATLTASQPCVYVANHQSYLDYPIMASVFPRDTVVVAKREIRRIPVVGTLFRLAGQTMIERGDAASAHATISGLASAIRRDRTSVWMFPEGTRNRVPGTLLPFKRGAFHLAVEAQVAVVAVVLSPLRPLFNIEAGIVAGRTVQLQVLSPEPPVENPAELHDRVRARMLGALAQIRTSAD